MADDAAAPAPSPAPPVVDPAAPASVAAPVTASETALTPEAKAAAEAVKANAAAEAAKAAKPADAPKASTAPEKYDYTAVKLPHGITLDAPLLAAVEPVFKELGVTQEGAAKLVEAHIKHLVADEARRETEFAAWMKTTVTNYQTTIRNEWGANTDANTIVAQRGMARVMSAEAKKLLDDTGLGNHPEFLKAFFQVGKMVSEDKPPNGQLPAGKKSNAEVFYGNTSAATN